jgi:hypothetical protein
MPSFAGIMDRIEEPAAIPLSPMMVMRCAPKRSEKYPAGAAVGPATKGPTDKINYSRDHQHQSKKLYYHYDINAQHPLHTK